MIAVAWPVLENGTWNGTQSGTMGIQDYGELLTRFYGTAWQWRFANDWMGFWGSRMILSSERISASRCERTDSVPREANLCFLRQEYSEKDDHKSRQGHWLRDPFSFLFLFRRSSHEIVAHIWFRVTRPTSTLPVSFSLYSALARALRTRHYIAVTRGKFYAPDSPSYPPRPFYNEF